jgi:mRNA interferase RelE/StbE
MNYELVYAEKVYTEDIPRLSIETKNRLRTVIADKLATNPAHFGKPLRTSMFGFRSLRVGNYRVIFQITKKTVLILAIMHRSVVYKNVQYRVKVR